MISAAAQHAWFVLCGMMLFSRFLFQWSGASAMRAFLDAWKGSRTVLGAVFVAGATGLAVWQLLDPGHPFLVWSLVAILLVDGLLNLLPGGFGKFKQAVQEAWAKKASKQQGDRAMFTVLNVALGAAAIAWGVLIWSLRSTDAWLLAMDGALAVLVSLALVKTAMAEAA